MSPNPYRKPDGSWWFHDETGDEYGPFKTDAKAAKGLLKYCIWLDKGPSRWQMIWWPTKRFLKALWNDIAFWRAK